MALRGRLNRSTKGCKVRSFSRQRGAGYWGPGGGQGEGNDEEKKDCSGDAQYGSDCFGNYFPVPVHSFVRKDGVVGYSSG
jgi:hypothetical protein